MIGVCQAKWGIVEKESTVCVKEAVDEFYWRKVMGGGGAAYSIFQDKENSIWKCLRLDGTWYILRNKHSIWDRGRGGVGKSSGL